MNFAHWFLTLLSPAGKQAYLAYDSLTRADADALGYTESKGPLGLARLRLLWTTIGGDFDIVGNVAIAVDAEATIVTNGDMELDSDWVDTGTPTTNERSGVRKHGGTYSRHVVTDESNEGARQNLTPTVGKLYRCAGWFYVESGEAKFNAYFPGAPYKLGETTAASWTKIEGVVAAARDGTMAGMSVDAVTEFYMDDVSVAECHAEYIDPGVADVVMATKLTTPASGTDPAGLILRRDGATQWLVQITPGTAGTDFQLIELDDSVPTARATADVDFSTSTAYRITAALVGQSIKVYVDGVEKLSYASASVGETNTQFGIWDSADSNLTFDDVAVWRYADYPHAGGY